MTDVGAEVIATVIMMRIVAMRSAAEVVMMVMLIKLSNLR